MLVSLHSVGHHITCTVVPHTGWHITSSLLHKTLTYKPSIKMESPIDPGDLVSQGYANFRKTVWMIIIQIHTALLLFCVHCHSYQLLEMWIPLVTEPIGSYQIQHVKQISMKQIGFYKDTLDHFPLLKSYKFSCKMASIGEIVQSLKIKYSSLWFFMECISLGELWNCVPTGLSFQ